MEQETIAAIATPFGSGGIGIIRISGTKATAIAGGLFQCSGSGATRLHPCPIDHLKSHHLTHGYIVDGEKSVDEVLLVAMKAPHSYTREDVVEIQSHSGAIVLSQILKLVINQGARLAEPGEFTKRAYLNGRIDLSQAEAVADIISAKSESSLHIGTAQLLGAMKSEIEHLITELNTILAQLEAHLEFGDEIEEGIDHEAIAHKLHEELMIPTNKLLDQYNDGHFLREGVRMGIVGRPNVGKSSLLNRLLSKDKAIVTHLPGTTRDLVEDYFTIKGIPIIVTDTAGLHSTENPIEQIGIQKTHESIAQSDLVLFVVDSTQPEESGDLDVYRKIKTKNVIMVVNKIDLVKDQTELCLPRLSQDVPTVMVSALTGESIETLKELVADRCLGGVKIDPERTIIPNMRQKVALDLALAALERTWNGLNQKVSDEFIIGDLEAARNALYQIIGQEVDVDILDEIFSQFCIGK